MTSTQHNSCFNCKDFVMKSDFTSKKYCGLKNISHSNKNWLKEEKKLVSTQRSGFFLNEKKLSFKSNSVIERQKKFSI